MSDTMPKDKSAMQTKIVRRLSLTEHMKISIWITSERLEETRPGYTEALPGTEHEAVSFEEAGALVVQLVGNYDRSATVEQHAPEQNSLNYGAKVSCHTSP